MLEEVNEYNHKEIVRVLLNQIKNWICNRVRTEMKTFDYTIINRSLKIKPCYESRSQVCHGDNINRKLSQTTQKVESDKWHYLCVNIVNAIENKIRLAR